MGTQASCHRWQARPDPQQAQVRVGPSRRYDQARPAPDPLGKVPRWHDQAPRPPPRLWQLLLGIRVYRQEDQDHHGVYNPCNNELVRTKTLVKNAIVVIDGTPFRQWYESHYATPLGRKKGAKLSEEETASMNKKRSSKTALKYKERQKTAAVEHALEDQFMTGRVLAAISSRPGQSGRADGYILEGKELEFYLRKIKAKKGNK